MKVICSWCGKSLGGRDWVKIVRCKDCKFGKKHDGTSGYSCAKGRWGCLHSGMKFCSDGERKE